MFEGLSLHMNKAEGVEWLRGFLGSEVKSTVELKTSARDAGLGKAGLKVSRAILDVASFRKVPMGPFFVCLPEVDHEAWIKLSPRCGTEVLSDEHYAVSLATKWHKLRAASDSPSPLPGIVEEVEWVGQYALFPMSCLKVSDIPSASALDMLLYAKDDPVGYRQMYHSKLMPTRTAERTYPSRAKAAKRKGGSEADGQEAIDRLLKKSSEETETESDA